MIFLCPPHFTVPPRTKRGEAAEWSFRSSACASNTTCVWSDDQDAIFDDLFCSNVTLQLYLTALLSLNLQLIQEWRPWQKTLQAPPHISLCPPDPVTIFTSALGLMSSMLTLHWQILQFINFSLKAAVKSFVNAYQLYLRVSSHEDSCVNRWQSSINVSPSLVNIVSLAHWLTTFSV